MHALPLALLLAAAPPAGGEEPRPAVAPVPVSSPSPPPRPAVAPPALIRPDASAPAAAAAAPAATPGSTPPLSRAAIEKIGLGDRAFLDRDYRNALFAYMDAAYLAPGNPAPHVKLGRTYLALRYPARAVEQAEKALAIDPANAEARKLIEEAKNGSRAPVPASPAAPQAAAPASPPAARVYRFVPDPQPPQPAAPPARAQPAAPEAAPRDEVPAAAPATPAPEAPAPPRRTVAATDPAPPAAAPTQGQTAAQRYRAALDLLQNREFEKAIAVLTDAVAIDPRLAVAFSARASAQFGLGRYRDAAADYRTALTLDAKLGTPLYGLAECYRVLGESKNAAEMYRRYADSQASDVREDLRGIAAKRAQELR